jgi:hypothetical protein
MDFSSVQIVLYRQRARKEWICLEIKCFFLVLNEITIIFQLSPTGRVIVHPLSVPAQTGPSWEEVAFRMQNPETPEDLKRSLSLFFSICDLEPPVI